MPGSRETGGRAVLQSVVSDFYLAKRGVGGLETRCSGIESNKGHDVYERTLRGLSFFSRDVHSHGRAHCRINHAGRRKVDVARIVQIAV